MRLGPRFVTSRMVRLKDYGKINQAQAKNTLDSFRAKPLQLLWLNLNRCHDDHECTHARVGKPNVHLHTVITVTTVTVAVTNAVTTTRQAEAKAGADAKAVRPHNSSTPTVSPMPGVPGQGRAVGVWRRRARAGGDFLRERMAE